jgi:hypothetical protein
MHDGGAGESAQDLSELFLTTACESKIISISYCRLKSKRYYKYFFKRNIRGTMEGPNVPSSLISLLPKSPISIGKLALIMAIYAFYVRYVTSTKQIKIC